MASKYGGFFLSVNSNLNNPQALDYLIDAVQSEMFGIELYPSIHEKAALYVFNIIQNHIFQDGNKRTGLECAILFLEKNGYHISSRINNNELINFALHIAK